MGGGDGDKTDCSDDDDDKADNGDGNDVHDGDDNDEEQDDEEEEDDDEDDAAGADSGATHGDVSSALPPALSSRASRPPRTETKTKAKATTTTAAATRTARRPTDLDAPRRYALWSDAEAIISRPTNSEIYQNPHTYT